MEAAAVLNDPDTDTAYPYRGPYRDRGLDLDSDLEIGLEILNTVGISHLSDDPLRVSSAARCGRFVAERGLFRLLRGVYGFARAVLDDHSCS